MRYVLLIILCFITSIALACDCPGRTVDEYLSKCDDLFVAKIIETKMVHKDENNIIHTYREEAMLSSPIQIIKGNPVKIDVIRNHYGGTSCSESFLIDNIYAICVVNSIPLPNSMCDFTRYLYEGQDVFIEKFRIK